VKCRGSIEDCNINKKEYSDGSLKTVREWIYVAQYRGLLTSQELCQ